MSLDSLYGGKQGISFVLKASFKSVEDMKTAFRLGPNYTDVWYGEYCIIDTPNKNDKTNGQIYRRGLDYQNATTAGAQYIGQIVGPSSGTPYFQLNTIPEVERQSEIELDDYEYRRYPTGYETDEQGHVIGYTTSDGSDGAEIATFPFSKAHDTSLVPGKSVAADGSVEYKDEITWTWCNIRKDNADADSWFYVGFEIPYAVIDYSIHMTSPYDEDGNVLTDATEIERVDDYSHPFYEHWDLGLPKGIKGDTLRSLRVIVPREADEIYDFSAITVNETTGETTLGNAGYAGIEDDIASGRQIVVFDYYIYDKVLNPKPIMIYLGDFNIITDVQVADDGTLTVSYTHDDNSVFEKKIKWVTGVTLTTGNGAQGGHFQVDYNNGDEPFEADLTWVKGIEIQENGTVTYTYAGTNGGAIAANGLITVEKFLKWVRNITLDPDTGEFAVTYNNDAPAFETTLDWIKRITLDADGTIHLWHTKDNVDEQLNNALKWVTDVSLSPSTGEFVMNFNYGPPLTRQLDWIDDIYINEENGEIILHHVNAAIGTDGNELLDARLKLITHASASADGVVTFHTNTGESFNIKMQGAETDFHIKTIDNVILNTRLAEDKRIQIKYNTDTTATPIGDPINYIHDMVVRPSDFHLLVMFNDPTHRVTEVDPETGLGSDGNKWVNNSEVQNFHENNYGTLYWRDYGSIKDQSGVLIGFNLDWTTVEAAGFDGNTGVIDYLNATYKSGLTGEQNMPGGQATKAKIVTYTPKSAMGEEGKEDKEFYAFDYNVYKWYYLGKITDSGMRDAKLLLGDTVNAENLKSLSTQGLLFHGNPYAIADNPIPKFWDITYDKWA